MSVFWANTQRLLGLSRTSKLARGLAQNLPSSVPNNGLIISDNCVKRLQQICGSDQPTSAEFLRISVEGGGCSGFQYKFDLESGTLSSDDLVFEREGAKVVIDETSLEYIKGSTVDFHTELIRSAFRITDNPLAETGCSCGASFTIKLD